MPTVIHRARPGRPRLVVPPGVFAPPSDTWVLAEAMISRDLARGAAVLDLCSGSGALAVTAGLAGARSVTAVDVSRRAVLTARVNGRLNGVRVQARRGDLFAAVPGRRFDLIVSNPPYVVSTEDQLPDRGLARAWEAGRDGRALLDRICPAVPNHLNPGGTVLLVHSELCGIERTLDALAAGGLEPEVVARQHGPIGPIVSARAEALEREGLLPPGKREELVVVIAGRRARRTNVPAGVGAGDIHPTGANET